jgi:2-polyprenyl-6-methoxyphenol hydroxylase-like FAD-dependent oxidoreductase
MLVEDLDEWPSEQAAGGTDGDVHYFVFPRVGGLARLYQFTSIAQKDRFAGPDRQQALLDSFRLDCLPLGDAIAAATPAGPCAGYPMHDTWTDTVAVPGVVLIGDAAGYSDPIIGEGLSIALRDARLVGEVLASEADWSPEAFAGYAAERRERMRRFRLCASVDTELRCTFSPAGRARRAEVSRRIPTDPLVAALIAVANIGGPDAAPAEAFEDDNIARVLAYP